MTWLGFIQLHLREACSFELAASSELVPWLLLPPEVM